jgi:uncharacterized membrane protein YeaQ/YmgE (transglycosylase-associated protein family)
MSILGWIILGALAGWIASKIVGTDAEQGAIGNIIFGIVGAVVGGWLVEVLGGEGVTGFNLWSFVVALVGAVVVIGVYQAIFGGRKL